MPTWWNWAARDIVGAGPRSYVGVDDTAAATEAVRAVVAPVDGKVVVADAAETGLPDGSADVVIGEAMLTMQGDKAKRAIVAEAFRVLRPGGRYAIHELGLTPDEIPQDTKDDIRRDLARSIKVNARPLTAQEWAGLLTDAGFEVVAVDDVTIDESQTFVDFTVRPLPRFADRGSAGRGGTRAVK